MGQRADLSSPVLQIFNHHLYELSKGMRPLALMTMTVEAAGPVIARLQNRGIAHHIHEACPDRVNVVFGSRLAVQTVSSFMIGPLCGLSAEHDFMLGVLLGYDREMQCVRFLERRGDVAKPEAASLRPPAPALTSIADPSSLAL